VARGPCEEHRAHLRAGELISSLDRFRQAQDASRAGYAAALRELRAGRKTSHWIWYVFPQLAGLGRSSYAVHYGLAGVDEAADYLRDPVLGARLIEAAAAVRGHVADGTRARLDDVMGSRIDAIKLVSSMTLFGHVAKALRAADPHTVYAAMAEHAEAILAAADSQGYQPCRYTLDRVQSCGPRGTSPTNLC
jgi:uncharacterized protein (DUF1810 family)